MKTLKPGGCEGKKRKKTGRLALSSALPPSLAPCLCLCRSLSLSLSPTTLRKCKSRIYVFRRHHHSHHIIYPTHKLNSVPNTLINPSYARPRSLHILSVCSQPPLQAPRPLSRSGPVSPALSQTPKPPTKSPLPGRALFLPLLLVEEGQPQEAQHEKDGVEDHRDAHVLRDGGRLVELGEVQQRCWCVNLFMVMFLVGFEE